MNRNGKFELVYVWDEILLTKNNENICLIHGQNLEILVTVQFVASV